MPSATREIRGARIKTISSGSPPRAEAAWRMVESILAAVGVALDGDVEGVEARLVGVGDVLRQHDGSGTGAEGGLAVDEVAEALEQFFGQQFQKRGGFATGNDEAVDVVEVFGFADKGYGRAKFLEAATMRIEITLQSQYTDIHEQLAIS